MQLLMLRWCVRRALLVLSMSVIGLAVRSGWVTTDVADQFSFYELQATRSGDAQRHEAGLASLFGQQGWVQGKNLGSRRWSENRSSLHARPLLWNCQFFWILTLYVSWVDQGFAIPKENQDKVVNFTFEGKPAEMKHGSVVIAAITSCTNTSNPSVMLGAGLVAKKATELGLEVNTVDILGFVESFTAKRRFVAVIVPSRK